MGLVTNTNFGNIGARALPAADAGAFKGPNKGFASSLLGNGNQANAPTQQAFGLNVGVPAGRPAMSAPAGRTEPMQAPAANAFAALTLPGLVRKPSQASVQKADEKPAATTPLTAKADTALGRNATVNAISANAEEDSATA